MLTRSTILLSPLFMCCVVAQTSPPPPSPPPPSSPSSDDGIQTWEIALAVGLGGLALLLCMYALFLCYCAPSPKAATGSKKSKDPVAPVAPAAPAASAAPAAPAGSGKPPLAAKKEKPAGTVVGVVAAGTAVATVKQTKTEKILGNKGCKIYGRAFPAAWGCPKPEWLPPYADGMELVELPGMYGKPTNGSKEPSMGSKELKKWILEKWEQSSKEEKGF